jgi:hypothetical protein
LIDPVDTTGHQPAIRAELVPGVDCRQVMLIQYDDCFAVNGCKAVRWTDKPLEGSRTNAPTTGSISGASLIGAAIQGKPTDTAPASTDREARAGSAPSPAPSDAYLWSGSRCNVG